MGIAKQPLPVKLFAAIMTAPGFDETKALGALIDRFGPVQFSLGPLPFDWSDYYEGEMGQRLRKSYYIFERVVSREILPSVKTFTNDFETSHQSSEGHRVVNIDPGYVARDKLVLASTKDFFHRIYIGEGIYAEVTLHYRKGAFRHFSWTYPDYKDEQFLAFLERGRAILVNWLRKDESLLPPSNEQ